MLLSAYHRAPRSAFTPPFSLAEGRMRACEAVLHDCVDVYVNACLTDAHSMTGRANKRLFLLDYDGTLIPCSSISSRPTTEVLAVLQALVADPRNVVYIISGRGRSELGDWFESVVRQHRPVVQGLGLCRF